MDREKFEELTKNMDKKDVDNIFNLLANLFEDASPAVKMMKTSHDLLELIQKDVNKITDLEEREEMDEKAKKYTEVLLRCIEIVKDFKE